MNKALLMVAAAGVVGAVAASALAQPAPAPQPPQQAQPVAPPPPPGPGPQARGPMPPGEGPEMPGMHGPRGWRHGPPSRAAAFHIERGDISIGVRCAETEPMRACVDAAIALMDKANTMTTP